MDYLTLSIWLDVTSNQMLSTASVPLYVSCETYNIPGTITEKSNYLICKTTDGKTIIIPKLDYNI